MKDNQIEVLKQTELLGRQFAVYGTPEEPLFLANDVAEWIEHSNVTKMLNSIDEEEKLTSPIVRAGQTRVCNFLTEAGLYEVLMQSRKPIAKQFKKGVKQILHEVRTKGGYLATTANETPEELFARALQVANATLLKRQEEIQQMLNEIGLQQSTIDRQEQTIKEQAPKVNYFDKTLQSVNTVTTTQVAKELGLNAHKLNQKLKQAGFIFRQSGQWMLHQPFSEWNLSSTRTQTYTRADGTTGTNMYTVWTERGRHFIHTIHKCGYNINKAKKEIAI